MFKNCSLILHKNFIYLLQFITLLLYYSLFKDELLEFEFLEVWVGQCCTLKCKHCFHLIPYLKKHNIYDIDELISDIRKICKVAKIKNLTIGGGEPLTNPNLDKLLEYLATEDNITNIELLTNLTIKPNEKITNAIKSINKKFVVRADAYKGNEEKSKELIKYYQENGIQALNPFEHGANWRLSSGINQKIMTVCQAKQNWDKCSIQNCFSLAEGIFSPCCRGIITERVYGQKQNIFEVFNIRKFKSKKLLKVFLRISTSKQFYKDFCRYCLGLNDSLPIIPEGEQL